ncbi:MAG: hypothetical protein GY804_04720 [Alphaproteobacteria bacterium]|nr:hypothetical protein [Alphaproteobacteria bacterium]
MSDTNEEQATPKGWGKKLKWAAASAAVFICTAGIGFVISDRKPFEPLKIYPHDDLKVKSNIVIGNGVGYATHFLKNSPGYFADTVNAARDSFYGTGDGWKDDLVKIAKHRMGMTDAPYFDSKGKLYYGLGEHEIKDGKVYKLIPWNKSKVGFDRDATKEEKKLSYDHIYQNKNQIRYWRARPGLAYDPLNKLVYPSEPIDKEFRDDIDVHEAHLQRLFPNFDDFPAPAKMALGYISFSTMGGFDIDFMEIVNKEEWVETAKQSARIGVSKEINEWTEEQFLDAAKCQHRRETFLLWEIVKDFVSNEHRGF